MYSAQMFCMKDGNERVYKVALRNWLLVEQHEPTLSEEVIKHVAEWVDQKQPRYEQRTKDEFYVIFDEHDPDHIDWLLPFGEYVIQVK